MRLNMLAGCLLVAGCARAPDVPVGAWAGEGNFEYTRADGTVITRDYATRLTIESTTLDRKPVMRLEIVSERGPLPGLNEDVATHLDVALAEAERGAYRMVGVLFNPKPGAKLAFDAEGPVSAHCAKERGAVVLRMAYGEGFEDTFRFEGQHLRKTGEFVNPKGDRVVWSEALTRE